MKAGARLDSQPGCITCPASRTSWSSQQGKLLVADEVPQPRTHLHTACLCLPHPAGPPPPPPPPPHPPTHCPVWLAGVTITTERESQGIKFSCEWLRLSASRGWFGAGWPQRRTCHARGSRWLPARRRRATLSTPLLRPSRAASPSADPYYSSSLSTLVQATTSSGTGCESPRRPPPPPPPPRLQKRRCRCRSCWEPRSQDSPTWKPARLSPTHLTPPTHLTLAQGDSSGPSPGPSGSRCSSRCSCSRCSSS